MDIFLSKVSQQAVSFAIRSGITVTTSFAYHQIGRYIASTRGRDRQELLSLKERLQTKIDIISPAIDLVEIISARGNTSLESALTLTKAIRHDIESLGVRLSDLSNQSGGRKRPKSQDEIKAVAREIKDLLGKIEDAVPFISLAVTTSGVELSSNLPHNVSPSRLLQASTLLTAGDTAYALNPFNSAQIGTTFTLSLYMLFAGHSHRQEHISAKDLTWKEVIYKCRVKLQRIPLVHENDDDYSAKHIKARTKIDEYYYELCLIEDLDDGRVHDTEELGQQQGAYEDVPVAGLRVRIPVHGISKLFYTNSGTLLGIEGSSSPILLLKRDINAPHPRKLLEKIQAYQNDYEASEEENEGNYALDMGKDGSPLTGGGLSLPEKYGLPRNLDPEWLAFGIFTESNDDDDDKDDDDDDDDDDDGVANGSSEYDSVKEVYEQYTPSPSQHPGVNSVVMASSKKRSDINHGYSTPSRSHNSQNMKSNLSVLECLLRLTALQNYQQASHLTVHDELLNLFLSDSALSGTRENRQLERENARRRIGFDPFGTPEDKKPLWEPKVEKGLKLGGTQLTSIPPERGIQRKRESMSRGHLGATRGDSGPSSTPSADRKARVPNTPSATLVNLGPWTPEQQLIPTLDHSCISGPAPDE